MGDIFCLINGFEEKNRYFSKIFNGLHVFRLFIHSYPQIFWRFESFTAFSWMFLQNLLDESEIWEIS